MSEVAGDRFPWLSDYQTSVANGTPDGNENSQAAGTLVTEPATLHIYAARRKSGIQYSPDYKNDIIHEHLS
jgi:hypothetical protein